MLRAGQTAWTIFVTVAPGARAVAVDVTIAGADALKTGFRVATRSFAETCAAVLSLGARKVVRLAVCGLFTFGVLTASRAHAGLAAVFV